MFGGDEIQIQLKCATTPYLHLHLHPHHGGMYQAGGKRRERCFACDLHRSSNLKVTFHIVLTFHRLLNNPGFPFSVSDKLCTVGRCHALVNPAPLPSCHSRHGFALQQHYVKSHANSNFKTPQARAGYLWRSFRAARGWPADIMIPG